jgi:hypothetical protein
VTKDFEREVPTGPSDRGLYATPGPAGNPGPASRSEGVTAMGRAFSQRLVDDSANEPPDFTVPGGDFGSDTVFAYRFLGFIDRIGADA